MKKKFLGALIALGGSALAIGSAFALYTGSLPADKTIQIGTKTTGDVVLHGGVVDADSAHATLNPTNYERTIALSAGFTKNSNSVYIQDYYLAKLEFKISSASTGVINALKTHSWVELGVQKTTNKTYGSYWGWQWSGDTRVTTGEGAYTAQNHMNNSSEGYHVAEDGKSISFVTHYPLFEGQDAARFLFHISMQGVNAADYFDIAESSYSVDFFISEPDAGYDMAYIFGTATGGGWEDKDEFRMTVDATASTYKWIFKTGTVAGSQKLVAGEYKLHNGDRYCHGGDPNHTWSEADDGKTFKWSGINNEEFVLEN